MAKVTLSYLPNYLRMYRKQRGLSQRDIAFLLGSRVSSVVSRYERRHRAPQLRTALAFSIMMECAVAELFAGVQREVEKAVRKRAKVLLKRVRLLPQDRLTAQKIRSLERIISKTHEGHGGGK